MTRRVSEFDSLWRYLSGLITSNVYYYMNANPCSAMVTDKVSGCKVTSTMSGCKNASKIQVNGKWFCTVHSPVKVQKAPEFTWRFDFIMVVDGRNVTNYGMETSTSLRGAKNKFTRWCKDCGFVVLTVTNISPVRY